MIIFLIFYGLYGLANLYVFLKVKYIFHIGTPASIFLGAFLLFMTFTPTLIYLCSFRCPDALTRIYAYIGYTWVALIVIFFSSSILFDLYDFIIRAGDLILQKDLGRITVSPASAFFISFLLSIALSTYGYFEAKNLRVERLTVETPKLPPGVNKLTIVQVSDLHLGIIVREKMLDKVIRKIEEAKPDMIVFTGDLLDAEVNHIDYLAGRLKTVNARLGKFAVTGNHEFYGGIKYAVNFIQNAGSTLLRGSGVTVQNMINIAGVDDPTAKYMKSEGTNLSGVTEKEILSKLPPQFFTLLLKHRPEVDKDAVGFFDLQLSGHAHKGQIFPISIFTKLYYRIHAGYSKLNNGSAVYVSRGAGTAGPPVRLFAPPEVAIIDVVSREKSQVSEDRKIDNKNKKGKL
ncbi:MAG: metallophosphoesterase [Candidatus Levybacteria bacterium]|nr:metallophosphoesterase [Candidatus Levybacteria bacterium]